MTKRMSYGIWPRPKPQSKLLRELTFEISKAIDEHGGAHPVCWYLDRDTYRKLEHEMLSYGLLPGHPITILDIPIQCGELEGV